MQATDRMIIEQIKAALNTQEDGADLVDIARNAHKAEQELASWNRKFLAESHTIAGALKRIKER